MAGREVREYTNLTDPKDKKFGKGKDRIDDEEITFQRMVAKMQEVAGERGGYLHGRGALDSDDLLYLKEQMEAEEDAERLLRRTEKRAFAAFKKAVAEASPTSVPLPLRVEPKPKSGIRQQDLLKRVVEVKPKKQIVSSACDIDPSSMILSGRPSKKHQSSSDHEEKDERNALIQLRDAVNSTSNLQANWTGAPCISNNQSRWAGIACLDWHVVHLVLEGVQLTGPLPSMFLQNLTFLTKLSFANNLLQGPLPNLTNLMHLEFVLMSRNHFSGNIPFGYIELPKLTNLELQENDLSGEIPPFNQQSLIGFNVSNNKLEGPIPATGVLQRFPMSSYANNSALCGDIPGFVLSPCPNDVPTPAPAPSSRKKEQGALQSWSIALIAAAAIFVPLSAIFIFLCYHGSVYRRKTKKDRDLAGEVNIDGRVMGSRWSSDDDEEEISVELEFLEKKPMFDLDDLLRAAAEEIGRGELGRTYKAMLECGSVVAVKRIKEIKVMSNKEFVQHMHLLGNISKHENLTEIISFYQSKEEKLIIYEYVADGSLYSLLHENRGINNGEAGVALDWKTRVKIIKEIAKGLEYLHECLVCHGNLNSSNVLIKQQCVNDGDEQRIIRVKLTDYGMGGVVPAHKLWIRETPEFNSKCREGMMMMKKKKKKLTSNAGDVYCFGILVLEIVTGRLPYYSNTTHSTTTAAAAAGGGGGDLSGWVRAAVNNDWSTDILDMEITGDHNYVDDMLKLTEIGLHCTNSSPHKRPTITQVLATLQHFV